ncbi:MAG: response regulator [Hyphomonadaceae bacterium]|nr:response regulator [Hyphomonadaceae bacterium]
MPATILVAEDHEPSRALLLTRLKKHGYHVISATNGAEAVSLTLENAPQLILMDLSLPVMDGIEAWCTIQEMTDHPPPAIALTAACIQEVRLTCEEIGFSAFLTKPCAFAALIAEIERALAPPKMAVAI